VIISIDLDGTLWHHQRFFREFMKAMQGAGHKVGILTSHKMIHEPADRALLRERGFPRPNFYIGREDGDADYAKCKAAAIRDCNIDIHFEDGLTDKLRKELGDKAYRVMGVLPRGKEGENFE
jgi:hypothetical protein